MASHHRSSSSKKRKSSKTKSSRVRSEDRHKKRSKKTKSKKLHHSDESSYSSDDSLSVSTSSSEDEYSRSRSRTASKVKGKRKRSERSSSKHRSSKKKKRSRRSVDSDEKKKTRKKKGRRELSVSSVSSHSQGDSSSGESELSMHRGRSRGKVKDGSDMGKLKRGVIRDETGSVSRSPDGRYSKINDLSGGDTLPADNTSRRLRSVIAMVKGREIEVEGDKGGHKEEIAYDHDECPPSKSNDSYDYVSKKDFSHQSQADLESRRVEHPVGEETLESNTNAKLTGDRAEKFHSAGGHSFIEENKGEVSSPMPSSTAEDLESILRLKALENLKKYRGGVQKSNPPVDDKKNNASDVKQLSAANIEFASNKSRDMHVSGVAGATRLPDRNSSPIVRRSSALPEGKVQPEKGRAAVPVSVNRPQSRVTVSDNSKESELQTTRKPEISSLTPRRESPSTHEDKRLVTESIAGKDAPEPPLRVDEASDKISIGNKDSPRPSSISETPTLLKPTTTLEEESSKEPPGEEDKEGSQFQQKTMSVMRGSETVQVSYKVYIPKKTPALARRLLRR